MFLIKTKYIGPTDHKGSRIKATVSGFSDKNQAITLPWDYELDVVPNHLAAAKALLEKRGIDPNERELLVGDYDGTCFYIMPTWKKEIAQ